MKKIIINHHPWQTRIALTINGELLNIYFSTPAQVTLERSFFRGIVTKVLPGIQTAFVDIGQEKAGFLHISEVDRELAIKKMSKTTQIEDGNEPHPPLSTKKQDIAEIFQEGQPVLVQVSKEPVYEKGAKLTTCFTLPGRFIVLMPNIPRIGISKKIEDRDERIRLREIVRAELPEGMGAIIRTTSDGRQAKDISKDISFLVKIWKNIMAKFNQEEPKARLYDDLDLCLQIVRDHLDDDVEAVITDSKANQDALYKFIKNMAPEYSQTVQLYTGSSNIFEHYGIEKQIEQALDSKVNLKSGGSLIIETTQAMTVVDVNTGKFIGKSNQEETILKTNLEAAEAVARQLRLRNIGGLIVIDFIDMDQSSNRQKLFKFFEKILRERDKFQSVVLKVSEFGLVQMTRKRSGKTLSQQIMHTCSCCHGTGHVKSLQTNCFSILESINQELKNGLHKLDIIVKLHPDIFDYITSKEYDAVLHLEKSYHLKMILLSDKKIAINDYKIEKK